MQKMTVWIAALLLLPALAGCASLEPPKEFEYLKETPVRVTELYFSASEEQADAEYIEIGSVEKVTVDVSGWQVTGAGRLALPPGTTLKPRQTLVLCKNTQAFKKAFSGVTPVAVFTGKLSNKGETIRIENPDGQVADEVEYDKDDPEVAKATGTGLSIRRTKVSGDGVWKADDPTPGRLKS